MGTGGSVGRVSGCGVGREGTWTIVWKNCVGCDSGFFCRWQIQVSVYYARRIPTHLR